MSTLESTLRQRLAELRAEFDKGQHTLRELEGQAASVRATLLRISGAVQVLSESLGEPLPAGVPDPVPAGLPAPDRAAEVALSAHRPERPVNGHAGPDAAGPTV